MKRAVKRLTPELLRLSSGGLAAVHLIVGEVPTLVDAGAPGRGPAIEREIRRLGLGIQRIVLTHGDPDHSGGSDYLRRTFAAEVWASRAEQPVIDRTGWSDLPRRRRLIMRALFGRTPPPTIDRWLDGADTIDGLAMIPTPGHTPGHIVVHWDGWLLAGDAFRSGGRFRESPWLFTTDRSNARRSIEALLATNPTGASSSHGPPADHAAERLQELVASWS